MLSRSIPSLLLWACFAHAGAAVASDAKAPAKADSGRDNAGLSMEELRQKINDRVAAVSTKAGQVPVLRVVAKSPSAAKGGHGAKSSLTPDAHEHEALHWSYVGAGGPQAWGQLKPEFASCARGERQSPINITDGIPVDLEPIKFDYKPVAFNVVDNGHTVQVNLASGATMEVNQRRYSLLQFHFHRPSEERINGRQHEMVAHFVHKDLEGRLAVVAVLIDRGRQHPVLQQVWNSLPLEKNEPLAGPAPLDLNQLLPEDRRYYTYMGSLTTPPCTEGVLWLVLKQPVDVAPQQIDIFSRLYPMNARPVQAASGRMIKESN